jgi:hypothetical protein
MTPKSKEPNNRRVTVDGTQMKSVLAEQTDLLSPSAESGQS